MLLNLPLWVLDLSRDRYSRGKPLKSLLVARLQEILALNKAPQPTPYSVRFAPAFRRV